MNCPKCGENVCDRCEEKVLESGSGFDGERTTHWVTIEATCPDCGEIFQYEDSN